MNEQKKIYSSKHKQILNIATWAKYLSWIVLALYVVDAIFSIYQKQASYHERRWMLDMMLAGTGVDYKLNTFYYLADIGIGIVSSLIKGLVSYMVLTGISLSLNMIVETDMEFKSRKAN